MVGDCLIVLQKTSYNTETILHLVYFYCFFLCCSGYGCSGYVCYDSGDDGIVVVGIIGDRLKYP